MLIYLEIGQLTYATTNNKMHLDGPPVFSRFLMEDNKGIGSFLFCSCKDGTFTFPNSCLTRSTHKLLLM